MSESSICRENVKGFQQCVKEILSLIEKDEDFSEMTAEIYDFKKSQLTKLVTELSSIHGESMNTQKFKKPIKTQHADSSTSTSPQVTQTLTPNTEKFMTPMGLDVTFSSSGGGFHISRRECPEFSSDSGHKHLNSPVKETKVDDPDVLLKKISVLEEDLLSLQEKLQTLSEENSNLKHDLHEKESDFQSEKTHLEAEKNKVVELQHLVSDLKLAISDSNRKIETMGKVLEASRKQVLTADDEKTKLKQDMFLALQGQLESNQQEITSLTNHLDLQQAMILALQKRVNIGVADISVREDEIEELNTNINLLKNSHSAIEDRWKAEIKRLETELSEKCELIDGLMADTKELKVKVVELERQREVISDEKREVIRQLSISLDHYMSEYKQLRQAVFGNKTHEYVLTS